MTFFQTRRGNNENLFLRAYKIEIIKLIKRKDTLMLWLMPLLSLLYAIGIATNSTMVTYTIPQSIDALLFTSSMATLIHGIFIFYVIFAVITARTLSSEIEDKSILFYIPRIRNRNTIYNAKFFSLLTALTVSFLGFVLVTLIAYFTILVQRADIANGLWFSPGISLISIGWLLSVFLAFVFTMLLVLMLSTRFKTILSVCIFLFVYVALSFVVQLPYVKYFSPFYYITSIGQNNANDILLISLNIILCILYSIVFNSIGKYTLSKKDL